jgi:hypothetical protein
MIANLAARQEHATRLAPGSAAATCPGGDRGSAVLAEPRAGSE